MQPFSPVISEGVSVYLACLPRLLCHRAVLTCGPCLHGAQKNQSQLRNSHGDSAMKTPLCTVTPDDSSFWPDSSPVRLSAHAAQGQKSKVVVTFIHSWRIWFLHLSYRYLACDAQNSFFYSTTARQPLTGDNRINTYLDGLHSGGKEAQWWVVANLLLSSVIVFH